MASTSTLTAAQLRTLRALHRDPGERPWLGDFGTTALAWHAREKVLGALVSRGLVVADKWTLTDAGRAVIGE